MVIAVRAIFVTVFPLSAVNFSSLCDSPCPLVRPCEGQLFPKGSPPFVPVCYILPETFFALFTRKHHLCLLSKLVVGSFGVALGTVEPFLATWAADGDLCVENVFTVGVGRSRVRDLVRDE